jgi:hypothetical protein
MVTYTLRLMSKLLCLVFKDLADLGPVTLQKTHCHCLHPYLPVSTQQKQPNGSILLRDTLLYLITFM